ncbi:1-acyl-sn-glycerol-3-phosphate acyltransferase [Streptoalloteichus tenebrarius]|uniref:1-acyl-sn-glycerol-3-phosphate acyltransferase n=1 Tax=Streptoalloteichus tenebrarius (strain ATCC 17920 / DSM 40477 / JCM 4838 / CBS 697.72 / NBRC 16177 / NCIMB 11028 / NRRL B-12390 / A12253. 1 / ISP 5477) TaxID=1933 RepID=A0ABT1HZL7_STRSD|nr:lysophospholipid acyltransferase family protein [Streptoalloteichus tenebrarius]MCP2260940.1 1-acyl-sn-glycerol-3-phosphate acyltransferase [Streptoalloteichus tenebrarius]BFF03298.1 lysophospholipid acyltransferase family protein [Streptoalloteichus tenebrarius]
MAKEKGGFWVGVAAALFHPGTRLLARRRFEGLEKVPAEGPALLVCNHISYLDPPYTAVFVHKRGRVPRFLAKDSLWKIPVLRTILVATGQIPVRRGSVDAQQSLAAAHDALSAGRVVAIYAEGTITRDPDFWPMRSRTGVARLALEHDVPVIPVVHWGTHQVYDHYRKRLRLWPRRTVVVRAGEPVDLSEYRGRPVTNALLREVTDLLMTKVRLQLAEVRGEEPPAEFHSGRAASGEAR